MNDDFSQRLLERIEQEHIRPLPRWMIHLRRGIGIGILLISLFCTAFLGSLLFLAIAQVDLEFLRVSSFGPMLRLLLNYIPIVWVIFFVLFCGMEVLLLRHGTRAYRYPFLGLTALVLLGASLLGLTFYASHLPERVEASFQVHIPPRVQPYFLRRPSHPRPEDGVLFGQVRDVASDRFHVRGPRSDLWEVRYPIASSSRAIIVPEHWVLIEGRMLQPGLFEGRAVRPYQGPPNTRRQELSPPSPGVQTF